jgi:flagellar basal body P-ring protein FlgI
MAIRNRKIIRLTVALFTLSLLAGCQEPAKIPQEPATPAPTIDSSTTIGSLTEIFAPDIVTVEGYGIIDGLNGTGSSECPPNIRNYLTQYILRKLPEQKMDVDAFINSHNTAVVIVDGIMPAAVTENEYFDVRVRTLPGTQTTSLEGGWLYGADLKATGSFGLTIKVLAEAEGPVFIDTLGSQTDKKTGYILAGGTVLDEYKASMALRYPDYKTTAIIRDKLNERFGRGTATALTAGQIQLTVPAKYKTQKQRFISIVKATYLFSTPELTRQRINSLVQELASAKNKFPSEIALEAIGKDSLNQLEPLLNSSDQQVRLSAAVCMLNLGSDKGLEVLRETALDVSSPYRIDAFLRITESASRNDAAALARKLLRDKDFNVELTAYEQLRKMDDITVTRQLIARNFYLEQIVEAPQKAIFVSRSGQPRIVLFGVPIRCKQNIFIQSADGNITINAPAGQEYISIMRKHPTRPNVIIQLKSSYELCDLIRKLCEEPLKEKGGGQAGLNVSYGEVIALLQQMCEKGAIDAKFYAGPLPQIGVTFKK